MGGFKNLIEEVQEQGVVNYNNSMYLYVGVQEIEDEEDIATYLIDHAGELRWFLDVKYPVTASKAHIQHHFVKQGYLPKIVKLALEGSEIAREILIKLGGIK